MFILIKNLLQAFISTASTIYKKIQEGVFDVSNEVCLACLSLNLVFLYVMVSLGLLASPEIVIFGHVYKVFSTSLLHLMGNLR